MASALKCKQCKDYYPKVDIITNNFGRFCSKECIVDFQTAKALKNLKKAKEDKFKERKRKFKLSDKKHQEDLTQKSFNKLRKLEEFLWFKERGLEPECISCGKKNMDWCCGHFKTVGAHPELRFDKMNTYLQCNRYCNKGLSGNINGNKTTRGYLQGLTDRFGEDKAKEIIEYCETYKPPLNLSGEQLEYMRKDFNKQIRELEKRL